MIQSIYSYSKKIDFDVTVLEYCFDEMLKSQLAEKLPFDKEDSNFAPEPSVAVGVQTDCGRQFGVIYLQYSKQLLVFGELSMDPTSLATVFRNAFPELEAFEVPATFKTESYDE